MAQFTVASGQSVVYDGRLLYGRTAAYAVIDNYENYTKSLIDVATGAITITEAFTAVTPETVKVLGTNDANNTMDSSTVVANKDGSVLERQEYVQGLVENLTAVGGYGKGIVRKTVTFNNTSADVDLFTVTGTVIARVFAVCTTNLTSAGGCNIGVDAGAVAIIADTACTDIDATEIWHDATPDASVELLTVAPERIIANGVDIVLDLESAKQVDAGVIEFYCIYTPLSADGAIVAA